MNYLEYLLTKLRSKKLQIIFITVLTVLTYSNIFANGFAWDDKDTVLNWEEKKEWSSIPRFILGETPPTHLGNYRPFRNILYIVDDKLWGTNPFGYHLQSIGIELGVSILILLITRRITKDPYIPFFTAMIFAVHPVHVEAITWITSSMDMFGILFMFGSLYLYIRFLEGKNHRLILYGSSIFLSWLAFNTNEVTLTLPGLILLFDFFFLHRKEKSLWKFVRIIPYALVEGSYLAMRLFIAQAGARSGYILGHPSIELFVMLKAFLRYLQVLILPFGLTINHSLGSKISSWAVEIERSSLSTKQLLFSLSLFHLEVLLAICLIVSSLAFAFNIRKKEPILSFAILWFYLSFLTTLNIIPTEAVMVERFVYVPSFGFILALVYLLFKKFPMMPSSIHATMGKVGWGIVFSLCLILALISFDRNFDWKNDETLWTSTVAVNPDAVMARIYLANLYLLRNDLEWALYHYKLAYLSNPEYPNVRTTLGLLYNANDEHAKAIEILSQRSGNSLTDAEHLMVIANAYRELGKYDQAIESYKKALKLAPKETSILNNLGAVYVLSNQYELAEQSFEEALKINPYLESTKLNLDRLHRELKK